MRHATNATEKPILSRRHGHPRSEVESPATKHAKLAITIPISHAELLKEQDSHKHNKGSILRNQTITLPPIGGGPDHGNETPYKTEFEIS
jgi:hypothetical protein